ncbi:L-lactate permease [Comamonas sp. JC664]|uniref:L-lactate permease n=1 Tax=Comamonas sp. JC664 TaxID=2801917 RepID=UPI00360A4ABE
MITIAFTRLAVQGSGNLAETFKELAVPIYSIGMVLAFAFVANYSGGRPPWRWHGAHPSLYLLLALPGWIGVPDGSDTSPNALFAALQATTAQQLGCPRC